VWMLSIRALLLTTVLLFASSLALRLVLAAHGVALGTLYPMTITHWDGLAVGSALAICLTEPHWLQRARTWLPRLALASIVGLVVIRVVDGDFFFWNRYMMLYGLSLLAFIFGSLVLHAACAAGNTRIARACSSAWLTLTGRYSYALYLIHVPVMTILYPLCMRAFGSPDSGASYIGAFTVAFVSATIVSWTAAMASWFLLEQRILALKRYFE
jgi:peptidoglycan/LPS O-acetylase OafA/YrhL